MGTHTTDPTDGYAVDRFREECHLDSEGYLHTGTASAHVNRIIINTKGQRR
ncbi:MULTISPECIES: hypothetical protein [Haloferax]|uniref:Uncharacterized protein n=2 Tax=Haloferax TaxID=2251 RepID=A0A1H7T319_HALLR|nr:MULTISPECIES: hypothetical protein [Haloferax]ELZ79670.1 hypothetical protein C455_08797 [Haloferax larsenii JCM 13917]ELZ89539.1 hypothetical protein C453_00645 [Haloferax elongans ATCC BAA-1513]UVE52055.1 hypothetical protein KU306_17240 [Haloferax larsenii]SEL79203.1 hypothetical protein SAMN04488691_10851 [Haloferax larsenii]